MELLNQMDGFDQLGRVKIIMVSVGAACGMGGEGSGIHRGGIYFHFVFGTG